MNRRGFLLGALAAPAVIRTPGLLMPVRAVPGRPVFVVEAFKVHWPYLKPPMPLPCARAAHNRLLRPGGYTATVDMDPAQAKRLMDAVAQHKALMESPVAT